MKVDACLLLDNPLDARVLASEYEQLGYDAVYTFEGRHDPFLPLAFAADGSTRLELMTAIAVAFARNPMTVANTAYDMQLLSRGRFLLGLGPQIRPHIEKRYSMPWSSPARRMREFVQALHAIWHSWATGEALDFRGEFYTHTLMTPTFNPGPNPYGNPKILLAAIGPGMLEVAGEVADGLLIHPFNCPAFIDERLLPGLTVGLDKGERTRADIEVSCQLITAMGDTPEQLESAIFLARNQIAFYASTPAYRPVLEVLGRETLQAELNALSKQGQWQEMAARIDDDLLHTIALVGTPEEVAARIMARCKGRVERVSPVVYQPSMPLMGRLRDALSQHDQT